MDISDKKIAILVHDYFEQAEFEEPMAALRDAGAKVVVISAAGRELHGLRHAEKGAEFTADLLLQDATAEDYDALVLPGGVLNADTLRMVEAAQTWAADFLETGRPLAVICHAPWLLVSAGLVGGRRLTSYHTIQDDIRNAGGEWTDHPVVIDENLITSRKPDDLPLFSDALITMLGSKEAAQMDATTSTLSTTTAGGPRALDEAAVDDEERLHALGYDKKRGQLDGQGQQELLADVDQDDADATHLSRAVPIDQQEDKK